jgi:lipopolysaccharide biosynthesis regulator YciM
MFQKIKGENSSNNKSNSTPCNLDYNPLSGPIILDPRNALLVDMAMVEGVLVGDFLYSCLMTSYAICLFYWECPTTTRSS